MVTNIIILNSTKEAKKEENKTYNGWTNYATWKINLEMDLQNFAYNYDLTKDDFRDSYELSQILEEYVLESLKINCDSTLTLNYTNDFIRGVNFVEIAEHIITDLKD